MNPRGPIGSPHLDTHILRDICHKTFTRKKNHRLFGIEAQIVHVDQTIVRCELLIVGPPSVSHQLIHHTVSIGHLCISDSPCHGSGQGANDNLGGGINIYRKRCCSLWEYRKIIFDLLKNIFRHTFHEQQFF